MPGGRPSKFKPEFITQAVKLCALGATDDDMADFFGVSRVTLNAWKSAHPEFLDALKASKEALDQRVERRLYERAMGYSHDAVKIFMPAGAVAPVYADYTEHYPPDPTSMIFWLKNRQPERWRDVKAQEVSGPGGKELIVEIVRFGQDTPTVPVDPA